MKRKMRTSPANPLDILILQHHTDSPAGSLLQFLEEKGLSYRVLVLSDAGVQLPDLESFKSLVVQGGGMNVDEEHLHPWLKTEKNFIRQCIDTDKKVLGICLGGQLIAEVLGAQVHKHSVWEVGWHKIQLEAAFQKVFQNISEISVFQWHGYRFHTPPGAKRAATNSVCEDQAFTFKDHVIGVQFHPESTLRWVQECAATPTHEYPAGDFVQTPTQILNNAAELQRNLQTWYFQLLSYWLKL